MSLKQLQNRVNKLKNRNDKSSGKKTSNNLSKSKETSHYSNVEKRNEIDPNKQSNEKKANGLYVHTEVEKLNNVGLISNESNEELFSESGDVKSINKKNNSYLDKVYQRNNKFKKIIFKNKDLMIKKTNKAEFKENENIDVYLCLKKQPNNISISNKLTKTPSSLETKNSSKVYSDNLKTFSTQRLNKIVEPGSISNNDGFEKETRQYKQELNKK